LKWTGNYFSGWHPVDLKTRKQAGMHFIFNRSPTDINLFLDFIKKTAGYQCTMEPAVTEVQAALTCFLLSTNRTFDYLYFAGQIICAGFSIT